MSTSKPTSKHRILFFAEGATLAHVGRPLVVAQGLDPALHEVFFARPASYSWVTAGTDFTLVDLTCQDSSVFARRLRRGQPLYDYRTLQRYVADDLALIDAIQPDLVVGDFRLSLSVSARLRATPYIALCDAYWSSQRPLNPVLPVLGFARLFPLALSNAVFQVVSPLALLLHALPAERLRARYGLPSIGFDLRRCYTDADLCLFANFPALYPEIAPGPAADFVGPIAWSPAGSEIPRLNDADGPLIYVSMGSSGDPQVLSALIPVLQRTGHRVVVASAGKTLPPMANTPRIRAFDFLPGDAICRQAALVICNGGSPTTNQALIRGVPVLGIASNMDQFLNMDAVVRHGSGILLRADRADEQSLTAAVSALLGDAEFGRRAGLLAESAVHTPGIESHVRRLLSIASD